MEDRGEAIDIIEPLIPEEASRYRSELNDLALEVSGASRSLSAALPEGVKRPLRDLVRSMNCYYSNLIEGHDTHPVDIERAMKSDFSRDPEQRNLQIEALAHIEVQRWIDEGGLTDDPLAPASLAEIHRRFCVNLPEELLLQHDDDGIAHRITPGGFRQGFVRVGRHVAPSPGAVPRLLAHMQRMYRMQGKLGRILGSACAHHRLVYVHPFQDMNGRVARMVAHAMFRQDIGAEGLWSVSRGLGRTVETYKARLAAADDPRHGGADGRGQRSEARLAEFAAYFLKTCIDQVGFMEGLMDPKGLRERVLQWAQRQEGRGEILKGSDRVLRAVLQEGELERGEVPGMLNVTDRQARKVTSRLLELDVLRSDSPRAPLRIHFPAEVASDWMPGLFPDKRPG